MIAAAAMLLPNLFGLAVLVALLAAALRAHSAVWRTLAASCPALPRDRARAKKFPEQVILAGRGLAFRTYVPLTVGIHDAGISLTLLPPFSLQCPPLFLPYDQLSCRRTDWFVRKDLFAIRVATSEVDVLVDPRLWSWLQRHCDLTLDYAKAALREAGKMAAPNQRDGAPHADGREPHSTLR